MHHLHQLLMCSHTCFASETCAVLNAMARCISLLGDSQDGNVGLDTKGLESLSYSRQFLAFEQSFQLISRRYALAALARQSEEPGLSWHSLWSDQFSAWVDSRQLELRPFADLSAAEKLHDSTLVILSFLHNLYRLNSSDCAALAGHYTGGPINRLVLTALSRPIVLQHHFVVHVQGEKWPSERPVDCNALSLCTPLDTKWFLTHFVLPDAVVDNVNKLI